MMDQEFDKVKDAYEMAEIDTTAACKHVGEIKQYIWTIKEPVAHLCWTFHTQHSPTRLSSTLSTLLYFG